MLLSAAFRTEARDSRDRSATRGAVFRLYEGGNFRPGAQLLVVDSTLSGFPVFRESKDTVDDQEKDRKEDYEEDYDRKEWVTPDDGHGGYRNRGLLL